MDLLVATFIGADSPGLVHALAEVVSDHGGNWETSHMTSAGGVFAGVIVVTVDPGSVEALGDDLRALDGMLDVTVRPGTPTSPGDERLRVLPVEIVGGDHPGIVECVAAAFARPRMNVRRLDSENRPPQEAASSVHCRVAAEVEVAAEVDLEAVGEELRALAGELGVQISLGAPR